MSLVDFEQEGDMPKFVNSFSGPMHAGYMHGSHDMTGQIESDIEDALTWESSGRNEVA